MKRKLTAVLLALCMVLGMLPMTALAAWMYNDTEYTPGDTIDVDGTKYYAQEGVTVPETPSVGDTLTYYSADKAQSITLTWAADNPAGEVTHDDTHSVTWTDNSNGTHTSACGTADCNYQPVTEEHTFENGVCTKCDAAETVIPAEKVTVTFNVNAPEGAAAPEAPEAQEIDKDGVLNTVPELTLEGYTFKGWATAQDATEADVTAETTFAETTTVYAVWEKVAVIEAEVTGETAAVETIEPSAIAGVETVVISLPDTADETVKTVEVSGSAFKTVADTENNGASAKGLDVSTGTGKVELDAETVKEISALVTNDTDKVALKIEGTTAPTEAPAEVGAAAKYVEVNLTVNGESVATKDSQLTGSVKVSVKMNLTINSATQKLVLWFIDGLTATEVEGAAYANGMVSWTTKHFSTYAAEVVEKTVDKDEYYELEVVQAAGATIEASCEGETDANGYYKAGSVVTGTVTFAEGKTGKVTVNGTEVTVDEDGGFTATIVGPKTTITAVVEDATPPAEELEVEKDTSDAKLDSYTLTGLTEGETFAYYIQNTEGTKVTSGSFTIAAETFTQAVEKGFTYRVWTISSKVSAVQVWNGEITGFTGYYDSNPETFE